MGRTRFGKQCDETSNEVVGYLSLIIDASDGEIISALRNEPLMKQHFSFQQLEKFADRSEKTPITAESKKVKEQ